MLRSAYNITPFSWQMMCDFAGYIWQRGTFSGNVWKIPWTTLNSPEYEWSAFDGNFNYLAGIYGFVNSSKVGNSNYFVIPIIRNGLVTRMTMVVDEKSQFTIFVHVCDNIFSVLETVREKPRGIKITDWQWRRWVSFLCVSHGFDLEASNQIVSTYENNL